MATVGTHAINASALQEAALRPGEGLHADRAGREPRRWRSWCIPRSRFTVGRGAGRARRRRSPGQADVTASAGNGTPGHLTGEMFSTAAGVKLQHVPVQGQRARGHRPARQPDPRSMFDPLQSVLPHVQGGKLRALAISRQQRARPVLPERADARRGRRQGLRDHARGGRVFAPARPAGRSWPRRCADEIAEGRAQSDAFRDKLGAARRAADRPDAGASRRIPAPRSSAQVGQGGARFRRHGGLNGMRLERRRAGRFSPASTARSRRQALAHQIKVGDFFGAADFVPVTQAHIMADTESLGEAGVRWLEAAGRRRPGSAACASRRSPIRAAPTSRRPACSGQTDWMLDLERRAIAAFVKLGVTMTDTCINYQTIQAPTRGEHVAFGDTGVVIYSNSVCGARSNFEGGPSALAAGLTGRTPRYGFHLDAAAPRDPARPRRFHAGIAQRLGRARRRDRPARRQLLGGAGDRGDRARAGVRRAQALRRGDGELRLDRAVSSRRHHARSRRASPMSPRATLPSHRVATRGCQAHCSSPIATDEEGRRRRVLGAAA